MEYNLVFRIIEIFLQLILVVIGGMALFTWKSEIRGKDKYKLAKGLLNYLKDVRFLIHQSKNNSWHQVYLNDILVNRKEFYNDQLTLVENEKVLFDQNIWGLFNHINTRSDLFLPEQVRTLLDDLCPHSGKRIAFDKSKYTYIQLGGVSTPEGESTENDNDFEDGIYEIHTTKDLTIKEYFMKWEKLITELKKLA